MKTADAGQMTIAGNDNRWNRAQSSERMRQNNQGSSERLQRMNQRSGTQVPRNDQPAEHRVPPYIQQVDLRVPPSDQQAEQAVLGAVLLDANSYTKAIEFVKPESFYMKKHRLIFRVMEDLFNRGEPTDLITVSDELKLRQKLDDVGGDYYLAQLTESVPFPRNIDYYAQIVQEKHILRSIGSLGEMLGGSIYNPMVTSSDLLDKSIMELFNLQRYRERTGYKSITPITHEAVDEIEYLASREGSLTGISSGFKRLDAMTGGFQRSELIILVARPSMGKTALALGFAYNAARLQKSPVGIISLEMSSKQIVMRLLSFSSGVPLYRLRNGHLSNDEWKVVSRSASKLSDLPLYIDDTPGQTITEVRARARRLQMQCDVQMIVLDYLQLMQPPRGSESQQHAIATISRQLKGLAKELDIPVIALSQLSRAVETRGGDKRPILSDLRDSGAIEQDADVVMFVYREAYYDKYQDGDENNTAEIILGKQRNGPTGKVMLTFLPEQAQFVAIVLRKAGSDPASVPVLRGGYGTLTVQVKRHEEVDSTESGNCVSGIFYRLRGASWDTLSFGSLAGEWEGRDTVLEESDSLGVGTWVIPYDQPGCAAIQWYFVVSDTIELKVYDLRWDW